MTTFIFSLERFVNDAALIVITADTEQQAKDLVLSDLVKHSYRKYWAVKMCYDTGQYTAYSVCPGVPYLSEV